MIRQYDKMSNIVLNYTINFFRLKIQLKGIVAFFTFYYFQYSLILVMIQPINRFEIFNIINSSGNLDFAAVT